MDGRKQLFKILGKNKRSNKVTLKLIVPIEEVSESILEILDRHGFSKFEEVKETEHSMDDLPDDPLIEIFLFLDIPFIFQTLSCVCRRFYHRGKSSLFIEMWNKYTRKRYFGTGLPSDLSEFEAFKNEYDRLMNKTPQEYLKERLNEIYPNETPIEMRKTFGFFGNDLSFHIYRRLDPKTKKHFWHYITAGEFVKTAVVENVETLPKYDRTRRTVRFDYEYSLRLFDSTADRNDVKNIPRWPFGKMLEMYEYQTGMNRAFYPGQNFPSPHPVGSIHGAPDSIFRTLAFREDPDLGTFQTYNIPTEFGWLEFVPLSLKEKKCASFWCMIKIMDLVYGKECPAVMDMKRKEALESKEKKAIIDRGMREEGSQCGFMGYCENAQLSYFHPEAKPHPGNRYQNGSRKKKFLRLEIWKQSYEDFLKVLIARITHGKDLELMASGNACVTFISLDHERIAVDMNDVKKPMFLLDDRNGFPVIVLSKEVVQTQQFCSISEDIRIENEDFVLFLKAIEPYTSTDMNDFINKLRQNLGMSTM